MRLVFLALAAAAGTLSGCVVPAEGVVDAPPGIAFPAQPFSAVTLSCADGTRITMDVRISSTALTFRLARPEATVRLTALGGPFLFRGDSAEARASLAFARDFSRLDLTYAIGGRPEAMTACT